MMTARIFAENRKFASGKHQKGENHQQKRGRHQQKRGEGHYHKGAEVTIRWGNTPHFRRGEHNTRSGEHNTRRGSRHL
jgi:hypothetical protein